MRTHPSFIWPALVALFWLAPGSGALAEATVYPISSMLSPANAERVLPVMRRAKAETEAVVAEAAKRSGLPLKTRVTAAYGSWFIPGITLGGDLDFLGVVDLGPLTADQAGAERAITGIEAVLSGFERRKATADVSMGCLAVEGLGKGGRLARRARAIKLARRMLEATAKGQGLDVDYPYRGLSAPYHFPPGVISLPLHPRAKYISNLFALDPAKAAQVREVSVQFFFTATLAGRTVLFQPLYAKAASPIESWRFMFEAVFATPEDRTIFTHITKDFDLMERRIEYGAFILDVARQEIAGGRYVKAGKRLKQAAGSILPGLAPTEREAFETDSAAWLAAPAYQFADLKAVAKIHSKAASTPTEAALRARGDVSRLLDGYRARIASLGKSDARVASAWRRFEGLIDAVEAAKPAARKASWKALSKAAAAFSHQLAPPREQLEKHANAFAATYAGIGVSLVPVATRQQGRILIDEAQIGELKQDELKWPGAWRVVLLSKEKLAQQMGIRSPGKAVRRLHYRVVHGADQKVAWEKMSEALKASNDAFNL